MVKNIYDLCYTPALFLSKIKLEQLQIAVLKWSYDLEKLLIFSKEFFHAIVQMCFEICSEWFVYFRGYDTQYLQFYRISNRSNCRSMFWSDHVTLVKLRFSKGIFMSVVQIYFQSTSEWFIRFTAYDTRYLYLLSNIELKLLQI